MEVVGYVPQDAGYALCDSCSWDYAHEHGMDLHDPEIFSVITDLSEGDSYITCDHCLAKIEHALTDVGRYYESSFTIRDQFEKMGIAIRFDGDAWAISDITYSTLRAIVNEYYWVLEDIKYDGDNEDADD